MLNFNELNKKKDISVFTKADLSVGNQIKLVVPFSTYKIGSVFTVIGDSLTENVIKFSGIGETFFKDSTGLIIQINGNKSILSSMFENIVQPIVKTEPKPIPIPVITPKNGKNGVRGDKGDRGDTGFLDYKVFKDYTEIVVKRVKRVILEKEEKLVILDGLATRVYRAWMV